MSWRTVVISRRAKLEFRLGHLVVRDETQINKVHLSEISILIIENTSISLTASLLAELSEKALDEEHFPKTHEIMSQVEQYMLELISDFDVSVHLENSIDIAMLLKAAPVTVSDICATLPEKICNYAKIENEFFGKKIFAFVNLKQFLSEEDIEDVYKFFRYEKLYLLLFEGYQKYNSKNEHILIIDRDMCII